MYSLWEVIILCRSADQARLWLMCAVLPAVRRQLPGRAVPGAAMRTFSSALPNHLYPKQAWL